METRPASLDRMSGHEGLDEFRVSSPRDVGTLLKQLLDGSILLNLNGSDGHVFTSAIWTLDSSRGTIGFNADPNDPALQSILHSREVVVVGYLESVKVQFDVQNLVLVHGNRASVLSCPFPREMFRFQRRNAFRVRPLMRSAPTAKLRHDIKISVKHSSAAVMIEAYRQLAEQCDYPLHLGVTEAGPMPMGGVKSAVGIGTLLAEGIGDTIRVSLTDDPVEEVKVGNAILQSLGLRERGLDLVACPSCGRAEVNVLELTKKVEAAIEAEEFGVPMRVAVMGCVVNGPGEAREADVGIASGNGLGFIIRGGEAVAKVPEDELVEALLVEARKVAADKVAAGA